MIIAARKDQMEVYKTVSTLCHCEVLSVFSHFSRHEAHWHATHSLCTFAFKYNAQYEPVSSFI